MNQHRQGIRRNRNIGTAKQGHGQNNRNVIPHVRDADGYFCEYYEVLREAVTVTRRVCGCPVTFLVEPTRGRDVYPCTVDDVCHVLSLLPVNDWSSVSAFVFRQPTRRQRRLSPVWGRLAYFAAIGERYGTMILLESQRSNVSWSWSKKLSVDDQKELSRLEECGHQIKLGRRSYDIYSSIDADRETLLTHTLPHEVGHLVEWKEHKLASIGDCTLTDEEQARLERLYDGKPHQEREVYAHRYADTWRAMCKRRGTLPFARIGDAKQIRRDGLSPDWFGFPL